MGIEKMKEKRSGLAKAVWAAILQLLGVFGRRKRERESESELLGRYSALCSWTGWGRRNRREGGKGGYRMEKWGEVFTFL